MKNKHFNISLCLPKVSIILATYNRAHFLTKTIQSVLNQSFKDFELIIVNDGSTDNTEMLVKGYDDSRVQYYYQNNLGRSAARNYALKLAKGQYITFIDSDDIYLPHKLKQQVQYLDRYTNVGMIYTAAKCIDEYDNLFEHKFEAPISGHIYESIAFFLPVTIALPTVMVRNDIMNKVHHFDENMHRFEDVDMWRRLSKMTLIAGLTTPTCLIRTHPENHLRAQNPKTISCALHYYAQKIIDEDYNTYGDLIYGGLANLYQYYATALLSIPKWRLYGLNLMRISTRYKQKHTRVLFSSRGSHALLYNLIKPFLGLYYKLKHNI